MRNHVYIGLFSATKINKRVQGDFFTGFCSCNLVTVIARNFQQSIPNWVGNTGNAELTPVVYDFTLERLAGLCKCSTIQFIKGYTGAF